MLFVSWVRATFKTYILISRGNDAHQIKQLLNGNYPNQMIIYVLANYIQTGIKRNEEEKAIPIIENECEKLCRQYIVAVEKAKQAPTQTMHPKEMLLEALRQMIFSPQERKAFDNVLPLEVQRQIMGATINVMGSSSNHHTSYEKYINPYIHD